MSETRTIRAVFINSRDRWITEQEFPVDASDEIRKLIDCEILESMRLPQGDSLLLDEEGLINGTEHFFVLKGAHQPFAGNAVIVGEADEEGYPTDAKVNIYALQDSIRFASKDEFDSDYLHALTQPMFIPMTSEQMDEYLRTGKVPEQALKAAQAERSNEKGLH